jgi:CheY-specific phosphatase CheX
MMAGSAKTTLIGSDHAFDLTIPSAMAGEKVFIRPKTGLSGVILRCCVDSDPMTIALWNQDLGE